VHESARSRQMRLMAGVPFDQGADLVTVCRPDDQVALPNPGHGGALRRDRTLWTESLAVVNRRRCWPKRTWPRRRAAQRRHNHQDIGLLPGSLESGLLKLFSA